MKKLFTVFAAAVIALSVNAFADETAPFTIMRGVQIAEKDIEYVSEYTLIGSPEMYDTKKVRVVCVLSVGANNCVLYPSKEDYNYKITKNGLWCSINPYQYKTTEEKLKSLDGKYVIVEGTFNGINSGHTDYYSGAVENITKVQEWVVK